MKHSPSISRPRPPTDDHPSGIEAVPPDWLTLTARYVSELEYGQVALTVHQGMVIEVQKTERTRLPPARRG